MDIRAVTGAADRLPPAAELNASVHDVILGLLDSDNSLGFGAKEVILDTLAQLVGSPDNEAETNPGGVYLTDITVSGFRGIGPTAKLPLFPAPGLTVVSGRNGSGKSSFAEGLELLLTGTSFRWDKKKEALWSETWQNLHHPHPCGIEIGFTDEGSGAFVAGMNWAEGEALGSPRTWVQAGSGQKQSSIASLGWSSALEHYRPVLSYEELGRLFDGGPSALYDALAKLLGLDTLAEAEKAVAATLKGAKAARNESEDERKALLTEMAGHGDERMQRASRLLRKRPIPLDDVLALATGVSDAQPDRLAALRSVIALEAPSLDDVDASVRRLRGAHKAAAEVVTVAVDLASRRIDLLRVAVKFHETSGDSQCPVCGEGHIDGQWAAAARAEIAGIEDSLTEIRSVQRELKESRTSALDLLSNLELVDDEACGLPAAQNYNAAVTAAASVPDSDAELAAHIEESVTNVIAAAELVHIEAGEALAELDRAWSPLAARLGAWVRLEEGARSDDVRVGALSAAKTWLNKHAANFRNLRLKPIAAQARDIWQQLRQESNVDLVDITLEGTATRRRVVLEGSVDGKQTKALSVMSQGELHALALALFLPRATAMKSPFRFVVLDDPIQAMDPSKIDGFVQVVRGIACTHQVIVFSHDDRLASVIRETAVDARLVEVVREPGSRVAVRDNMNPALRQVSDVFALIKDERLADDIKSRVAPVLFRTALEAAAKQAYYARQRAAGASVNDVESQWNLAKRTSTRLALAVHGKADEDLTAWLDKKPERRRVFRIGNAAAHGAQNGVSIHEVRDLEKTVREVLALK